MGFSVSEVRSAVGAKIEGLRGGMKAPEMKAPDMNPTTVIAGKLDVAAGVDPHKGIADFASSPVLDKMDADARNWNDQMADNAAKGISPVGEADPSVKRADMAQAAGVAPEKVAAVAEEDAVRPKEGSEIGQPDSVDSTNTTSGRSGDTEPLPSVSTTGEQQDTGTSAANNTRDASGESVPSNFVNNYSEENTRAEIIDAVNQTQQMNRKDLEEQLGGRSGTTASMDTAPLPGGGEPTATSGDTDPLVTSSGDTAPMPDAGSEAVDTTPPAPEAVTEENFDQYRADGRKVMVNGKEWDVVGVTPDGDPIIQRKRSDDEMAELAKGDGIILPGTHFQRGIVTREDFLRDAKWTPKEQSLSGNESTSRDASSTRTESAATENTSGRAGDTAPMPGVVGEPGSIPTTDAGEDADVALTDDQKQWFLDNFPHKREAYDKLVAEEGQEVADQRLKNEYLREQLRHPQSQDYVSPDASGAAPTEGETGATQEAAGDTDASRTKLEADKAAALEELKNNPSPENLAKVEALNEQIKGLSQTPEELRNSGLDKLARGEEPTPAERTALSGEDLPDVDTRTPEQMAKDLEDLGTAAYTELLKGEDGKDAPELVAKFEAKLAESLGMQRSQATEASAREFVKGILNPDKNKNTPRETMKMKMIKEKLQELAVLEMQVRNQAETVKQMKAQEKQLKNDLSMAEGDYVNATNPEDKQRKLMVFSGKAMHLASYQDAIKVQASLGRDIAIKRRQTRGYIHRKLGTHSAGFNVLFGAGTAAMQGAFGAADAFEAVFDFA